MIEKTLKEVSELSYLAIYTQLDYDEVRILYILTCVLVIAVST